MSENEIRREIEAELDKRKKRVVNENAINALFAVFPGPVQALGKVIFGRNQAIQRERRDITIERILTLLSRIDGAISDNDGRTDGIDWTVIGGDIEAYGENVVEVTGVDILGDAGPVELTPGTCIRASGKEVDRITGLRIGHNPSERKEN